MENLNTQQKQAVLSKHSRILCIAGAGSGKTNTLANRVAYLLNNRVHPRNISCITFTRYAGKEMKERIYSLNKKGKSIFCNTFHSFCLTIIKKFGHLIDYDENFSIYQQDKRKEILEHIISQFNYNVRLNNVDKVISDLFNFDKYNLSKDEEQTIKEYLYILNKNNAIDLDLILYFSWKLLNDFQDVREYYHEKFNYIFIDEYQDSNDIQIAIVDLINPKNLFCVGDPRQAIYGWRNAKIEYILGFKERYPNCEIINLVKNYRSSKTIVNHANSLIKNNFSSLEEMISEKENGKNISLLECDDFNNEIDSIAAIISDYENFSDIAILSRNNRSLEIMYKKLKAYEIPCKLCNNKDDVFDSLDFKKLLNVIQTAKNTKDTPSLKFSINFPSTVLSPIQINKIEIKSMEKNISFFNGLKTFKFKDQEKIDDFTNKIEKLQEIIYTNGDSIEVIKEAVKIFNLDYIFSDSFIQKLLEKVVNWRAEQLSINESVNVSSFIDYVKTKDIQDKIKRNTDNVIRLMTIHASKGLEFNTVFLIGLNQDNFPHRKGNLLEERNLAYVGVTRAKSELFITRSKTESLSYLNNKIKDTIPSIFIKEMNLN